MKKGVKRNLRKCLSIFEMHIRLRILNIIRADVWDVEIYGEKDNEIERG